MKTIHSAYSEEWAPVGVVSKVGIEGVSRGAARLVLSLFPGCGSPYIPREEIRAHLLKALSCGSPCFKPFLRGFNQDLSKKGCIGKLRKIFF